MFNLIPNSNLQACQCVLGCWHRKRRGSLKRDAVLLNPFILNHTPYNKNMFNDSSVIGGKL